ncbi:MAG: UDP-N-acetylmuramoyl-L-alanyl-D-glutamate--2,6-diaminopimelate ligase [Wenzhouxiangellaceae bacterium]|nr:UDP-N-acetylmuramoyl-L-alanyl-D-glutamate--2,6-diaminopimelate ligase [Wenzhouxiangellaceae bacterium]
MKLLSDLLAGLSAEQALPPVMIGGLSLDSRRIRTGDAFIALAGARAHGLEFADQALQAGAAVVLHDGQARPSAAIASRCIALPQLGEQLALVARRFWDDPADSLELTAVTGTNGKSSVAWLLAQALDGGVIGTLGTGRPAKLQPATHTTPDLLSLYQTLAAQRDAGIRHVAIEASSHALAQHRLAGLEFQATIFTNLGHDHLDYHGNMECYGAAKARLFKDYSSRRQLLNIDDPFGRDLADELAGRPGLLSYGLDRQWQPDVLGVIQNANLDGLVMDVVAPHGRVACQSRLLGRVNAYNIMIVVAELLARGWHRQDVARKVATLEPVPGRMNRVDGPAGQRVIIDYAHTPDALQNALAALRELTPERLICVFGCGGERDRAKRPDMGRIAETLADRVIVTDDNPRRENNLKILREIQAGMARPDRVCVIPDRRQAIARAVAEAEPGDCVLLAGKGHEQVQDVGDQSIQFSDFEAVRAALTEAA